MMFHFDGDVPAVWVIGQIDGHEASGAPLQGQGLALIRYQNGVPLLEARKLPAS